MCAGACKCKERKEIAKGKLEDAIKALQELRVSDLETAESKGRIKILIEQAIKLI